MFSVLILTLNEEKNLPRCLASARGCDDVVVLDSGSTDRTVEIASNAGARVVHRRFDNFADHRNFAQTSIPFPHPWVFHLDADETLTPELIQECNAAGNRPDVDGYFVAPKMMFQGRWIPHCTDFPAYQARFVAAPRFRFVQVGHGQREAPDMRMARLRENYLHDISAGGEDEWLEKHRRYALHEAHAHLGNATAAPWKALLTGPSLDRRRALKRLSFHLPGRPWLRFIYQYVARGGFLDGRPGLRYCRLLSMYEGFIAAEIRRLRKGREP
jgi:Glycosyltransferases involved in cell wall biogenesis